MTMLLQVLGFAALASAMHATPRPLRLRDGSRLRNAARISGGVLLCLSMLTAVLQSSFGIATLHWFGLATISAALVTVILTAVRKYT
jgi:hypothetical protein